MPDPEKRLALLIDADNAPASKIDVILTEVARHGAANVRRAYGNWKSPHLKGWEATLHEYAIRPIQQFAYSTGKNASDMAMVIDAMDLLYAGNLDAFAIVSSDGDFTPLVMRLLTEGVKVYGFGEQKTPKPFVNACSKFIYLEALAPPTSARRRAPRSQAEDREAAARRRAACCRCCAARSMPAATTTAGRRSARSGSQIGNQASFDPRNYGYRKLSDLIEAIGLFEVKRQDQIVWVREKPKGGSKPHRRAKDFDSVKVTLPLSWRPDRSRRRTPCCSDMPTGGDWPRLRCVECSGPRASPARLRSSRHAHRNRRSAGRHRRSIRLDIARRPAAEPGDDDRGSQLFGSAQLRVPCRQRQRGSADERHDSMRVSTGARSADCRVGEADRAARRCRAGPRVSKDEMGASAYSQDCATIRFSTT